MLLLNYNRGHGLLLRDQEEPPDPDREAGAAQVRSARPQARPVQGIEDEVSRSGENNLGPARPPFEAAVSRSKPD